MHRPRPAAAPVTAALAVIALALLAVRPASAAGPEEREEAALSVPEIRVSATRIEATLATSPDAITVVTREEIEELGARTVADALAAVPGLSVSRTGQPGGQASAFLRGANSGHTLVLIDGVRANNAFNGRFDFADLPVDNVERIEVLRGPQSTRHGSDALGGVVNIVTRRAAAATGGSALVEAGSNDSLLVRGSAGVRSGTFGLSVEASTFDTDNERPNAQYHAAGGAFGASWRPGDRLEVSLSGSHRRWQAGTPNDVATSDPNDLTRSEATAATLLVQGRPAPWWDARLSLAHGRDRVRFEGPEPNPPYFSGDLETETVSDSWRADLENVFAPAPAHRLLLGLSYDGTPTQYSSTSSFGTTELDEEVTARAVSAQYDWQPARSFTGSLGGRVDDFSSFGTRGTWRAGARYTTEGTGTILRANAGTGFRAPTIADLYYPGFGNPDLEPERSLGWDLGVEQPLLGGRLQVGATWFRNEFDNLIAWSPEAMRPENVADARTDGVEAFVQAQPTDALTLSLAYTWLRTAKDLGTGERLLRRPEHVATVGAHCRFPGRVRIDTSARIVGTAADKDFSAFPAADVENDAYVKWDAGATLALREGLSLVARVENLLDASYEEAFGFPALGRTVWGGAELRF